MKQIFRRDVLYSNLEDQQRNDSYQPNEETKSMINLDDTLKKLDAHREAIAKTNARIARDRADRAAKAAKTDAQESQELEATQERTDSEKRLDAAQDEYLASRGLKKEHPKLDRACNDYLASRGLNPNYDSSSCYKAEF